MNKRIASETHGEAMTQRAALLIDGENVSHIYAGQIIIKSLKHGPFSVSRVYGNVRHIGEWDDAPSFRVVHSGSGKNAADIVIAIDAVTLSFEAGVRVFVLVTSDRDFSHLVFHLRERGCTVIGIGEAKTPDCFRKACHDFIELSRAGSKAVRAEQPPLPDISPQVVEMLREHGGSMPLKVFGAKMGNSGIPISERPEGKWRTYLEDHPEFFCCIGEGQDARVELVDKT